MAIPAELPSVGTQDPSPGVKQRRGRYAVAQAQFEARPLEPPPLKMLSIGGSSGASIALK